VIAGRGVLSTAGLPVCPRARLRNASPSLAMQRCGPALVGRGRLGAFGFIANQKPFPLKASTLVFNGRTKAGGPAVWVHVFSANPPLAIVLPFIVRREGRRLQTSLTATVPAALGDLPHLASFELTLHRRYRAAGALRSYLSASCPAPAGFTAGYHGDRVFPLPIAHPLRASSTGREAAMKLSPETPLDPDRLAATAPGECPDSAGGPPDSPGGEIRAPDSWTG
jgi:hypothetical protein